jgi:hypothetical protein
MITLSIHRNEINDHVSLSNLAHLSDAFRYIASENPHRPAVQPPRPTRIETQDELVTLLQGDYEAAYNLIPDDKRFRQIAWHLRNPSQSYGADRWTRMQSLFETKRLEFV